MACESGCLCAACCAAARDFAFDHWCLDRPYALTRFVEPEPPMVSKTGYWYDVQPESALASLAA